MVQASADEQAFQLLVELLAAGDVPLAVGETPRGRGLVATSDIQPGTPLLSADLWSLLLVTDEPLRTGNKLGAEALGSWQALHGPLPPLLASFLLSSRADWFRRLMAFLLHVRRHGAGPFWQLYMQLLPQESGMTSLMNFRPEERGELQCPELIALAESERAGIAALHDSLFSSSSGELRALDLAPGLEDTLWAACMVNSRCFSDQAGREAVSLMAPGIDLVNHATQPNAAYQLEPGQGLFRLSATQPIPAGEEVCISYLGPKPDKANDQLLKDYGFVLPGNAADKLGRCLQPFEDAPALLDGERLARAAAACPPASLPPGSSAAEAAAAEAAHRGRQQAVIRQLQHLAASPRVRPSRPEPSTELQLAQQLRAAFGAALSELPTSLQQDEQLLASGAPRAPRAAAALAARLERKRLLAAAEGLAAAYLAGLGAP